MPLRARCAGVFRSDTNGDTWVTVNDGLVVYSDGPPYVHAITEEGGVIYLKDYQSFFYSNTRGESWRRVEFPERIKTGAAFAVSGGRIYINEAGDGVVYSDDYGTSWTPIRKGLPAEPPEKLMTFGSALFAKCSDNLFRLRAGEASWTKVANLQDLRFIVAAQNALIIGSQLDLRRSTDEGDSWAPMTEKVLVTSSENEDGTTREFQCFITVDRNRGRPSCQINSVYRLPSANRYVREWMPPTCKRETETEV